MASLDTPAVKALLDAPNHAVLTTVNEDATMTSSVIWVNVEDGQLAINGVEGRRWCANLVRDGRLTLVVLNQEHPYEYVEVRGRAVQARGDDDAHIDRLAKKYQGKDVYGGHAPDMVRQRFVVETSTIRYRSPH